MFTQKNFHPKQIHPKDFNSKKNFTQKIFNQKFFTQIVRLSFVDLRWAQLYVSLVCIVISITTTLCPVNLLSVKAWIWAKIKKNSEDQGFDLQRFKGKDSKSPDF